MPLQPPTQINFGFIGAEELHISGKQVIFKPQMLSAVSEGFSEKLFLGSLSVVNPVKLPPRLMRIIIGHHE